MILILGAGAIGTILAAHLAAAGRDVALYARPKDAARFGALDHLRVDYPDAHPPLCAPRPRLVHALDLAGVRLLVIGVKYPDLGGVLDTLPDPIPAGCAIVSTLNGVAPLRLLRQRRPGAAVLPVSVMMNAQLEGPLHARLTTRAELVFGTQDAAVLAPFRGIGIDVKTACGDEAVWGKLLINLANAVCALTRTTFKDLLLEPDLRRIYVSVLDEATQALDAAGLRWKLPLLLPYAAYRWALLHGGPLPWWFARYRNGVGEGAYPSMVADVQAGRLTEVDQLNGEILRLGAQTGTPVPINAQLVSLIQASRQPAPLSPAVLRAALRLA